MIKLDTITRSLQIVLTAAKTTTDMPVVVSYTERTATATTTTEGTQLASSNGTTPVTICAAPTSSTIVRSVEHISVKNADTALKVVTINLLDTATNYALVTVTLAVGDELTYTANAGWQVLDTNGNIKYSLAAVSTPSTGDNSTSIATTAFVQNSTLSTKLPTIGCSQASGALTFSASPIALDFRSTTLTSGTISTIYSSPTNLVLPSGGTLGAVSTVSARIIVVEINNAGTAELAIVNIAGGNDLSETGVINTTAISAASTANNVFYSTTARTGVAYRVVGAVDAVNTAGAWGNPTLVQGSGGQALTAMGSSGYGQTWQNLTGSRSVGTTYYNIKSKEIKVMVTGTAPSNSSINWNIVINGSLVAFSSDTAISGRPIFAFFTVPPGNSYAVSNGTGTPTLSNWMELQ